MTHLLFLCLSLHRCDTNVQFIHLTRRFKFYAPSVLYITSYEFIVTFWEAERQVQEFAAG